MQQSIIKNSESLPNEFREETPILDYSHLAIQNLIKERNWNFLDSVQKIKEIYNFVRDEIPFGYNEDDAISASKVLSDGYGQCNTKANLLMALLRATGIPCRFQGFTIDKALQKGAISGLWYKLAPQNIVHSWVEVQVNSEWFFLEGVILDKKYLQNLQNKFKNINGAFCGFGVYTSSLQNPVIDWDLNNTFIQDKGINQDFGTFSSPDEFYNIHSQKLGFIKKFAYKYFIRHRINKNVDKIRNTGVNA